jgi:protein SCO1
MTGRALIIVRLIALLGLGMVATLIWFVVAKPIQVLPRMQPTEPFTLIDQTGRWFGSDDLYGRVTLVSFGYTTCGGRCAEVEAGLHAVRTRLRDDGYLGSSAQIVTISLDPENDTPDRIRGQALAIGASAPEWHLLTGVPAEVKQLVGGNLGVYYTRDTDGGVAIDQQMLLIDGSGVVRAKYATAAPDPDIVARDVGLIVRESVESVGAQRAIYEAAHVFVCYPE